MSETIETEGAPLQVWAPMAEIEESALAQLKRTAALPWVFHHVAAMPDVHYGIGATVGSVVAMKSAVAPAAVGVDIGCGMAAVDLGMSAAHLPDGLAEVRHQIERTIPVGFNWHKEEPKHGPDQAFWDRFKDLAAPVQMLEKKAHEQIGTLGGGNHFIELCLDEQDCVWLMLHSGSRGIGNQLASHHIEVARRLAHNAELPDKDLAVFLAGTEEMAAYRRDLYWAQEYALHNRRTMIALLLEQLGRLLPIDPGQRIECHHNYVAEEFHFGEHVMVTRKGAISADLEEWGIIPGSMGTKSYLVKGLGNPESFRSASHGAGRRMSRGKAKKTFTLADMEAQTAGVECRKDAGVIDEIPGAYKDIDQVIANEADLVRVIHTLKQVLCVKG